MTRLSPTATLSSCMPLFRSDRKSTRLNSSHDQFSYAVFCLKKKIETQLSVLRSVAPSERYSCPSITGEWLRSSVRRRTAFFPRWSPVHGVDCWGAVLSVGG